MLRRFLPAILIMLALTASGCLSQQTRAALDRAEKRVETLTARIDKEALQQQESLAELQQELADAQAKLKEAAPADSAAALAAVSALRAQVAAAEQARVQSMAALQQKLEAAQTKLATVQEKADDELIEKRAAATEQVANVLSPWLGAIFPGDGVAIGAIGLGAGSIKRKKAAKRKAAATTVAGGKL